MARREHWTPDALKWTPEPWPGPRPRGGLVPIDYARARECVNALAGRNPGALAELEAAWDDGLALVKRARQIVEDAPMHTLKPEWATVEYRLRAALRAFWEVPRG